MDESDSEVDDLLSAIKDYYPNASVSIVNKNIDGNEDDALAQNDLTTSENPLILPNLSDSHPMIIDDILKELDENLGSITHDHDYISPIKIQENIITNNTNINNAEGQNKKLESDCLENVTTVNTTPVNITEHVSINSVNITPEIISLENMTPEKVEDLVDDPDWVPQPHDISENEEPNEEIVVSEEEIQEVVVNIDIGKEKSGRKRKIHVDKNQWFDIKNKSLREQGKNYVGWQRQNNKGKRGPEREGRKMGQTCDSKICKNSDVRDCQSIDENTRQAIFNDFWGKMSWDQKKVYIVSLVKKTEKRRETKKPGEQSRRNFTYEYKIKLPNGNSVPVCKTMFLSTFGLKEWSVMNWVSGAQDHGIVPSKKFINSSRTRKTTPDKAKEILAAFLDKIPKLPSHYCRQSTTKVYIEPTGTHNMSDVYREYQKMCQNHVEGPVTPLSRFTFDVFIQERNLSFQPPKKDRCDLCISHEEGNVSDAVYKEHIERKNRARDEMKTDTENGVHGSCIVLTQDLQSVKICPSMNASALYYKTKLLCHNFTIYDVNLGKAKCYWFDESQCDLSANTYATCVIDYMTKNCLKVPKKPIILWSDGCTSQNRNSIFSNALLSFSVEHNLEITQKFLVKGHTQMEVDSVHSVIERKIKNKPIYLPSDYVRYTKSARQNEPYETTSLTFDFIRNYSVKESMMYESIRPGKSVGDPTVTDIRAILYTPSGDIKTKLNFNEDFQNLPRMKNIDKPLSLCSFPQLHSESLKISNIKWKNLQDLKSVLPRDCHSFYDNLKFEETLVCKTRQSGKDRGQKTLKSGCCKPTKKQKANKM